MVVDVILFCFLLQSEKNFGEKSQEFHLEFHLKWSRSHSFTIYGTSVVT